MSINFQFQIQPHTLSILPVLAFRNFEVINAADGKKDAGYKRGMTIGWLFFYLQIFER